jgi:uncharacterized protein YidB (DUF937 family)
MSLLDGLKEQVVSAMGGGAQHGGVVEEAMGMLQSSGGLSGLVQLFQQKGMGDMVSAWIKTGPNPPISGPQVQNVFGGDQIAQLAAKLGVPPQMASSQLASVLPTLIDKLTPEGQIPQGGGSVLDTGMDILKKSGLFS